ncbi:hypothetical protein ACKFKG_26245 [Phormidesmis sp. 146-35]
MTTLALVSYRAVRIRQTDAGGWLILFAAPATEIDDWAGIPQKKEIGSGSKETTETTGFQREEDKKRIKELGDFYSNDSNIIQNPLLCATRQTNQGIVRFEPDAGVEHSPFAETGVLIIQSEPLEEMSLLDLLRRVKTDLERRVYSLASQQPSDKLLVDLKRRASTELSALDATTDSDTIDEEADNSESSEDVPDSEESTGAVFSDESHIFDFWEEVAARVKVLEELGSSFNKDEFIGYSKDAMISFLRPIVVVDGQHRLRGAVESAKSLSSKPPYSREIEQAILDGADPDSAQSEIEAKIARRLPVSLLVTDDPAEHVFQFVVVNQKATPIGKALLGTIVSTSLSNEELTRVSERLEKAGIQLEESRAVAYFTRNPHSPFYQRVERGLTSENKDLLQWNVLLSLVRIFQELKGGRLFGEKNDYADKWRRTLLARSEIVADWESKGFSSPFDYWNQFEGPWRDAFAAFWSAVRDKLADVNDDGANNYWGSPRTSNIFNKVSLTILAADFFQYLCERRLGIGSVQAMPQLVDDWLDGVNTSYFNRGWNLEGVRKDAPARRKQWAKLWSEYRKDPERLPKVDLYRLEMKD